MTKSLQPLCSISSLLGNPKPLRGLPPWSVSQRIETMDATLSMLPKPLKQPFQLCSAPLRLNISDLPATTLASRQGRGIRELEPGAGDVFVLDLLRLFGLVAGQVMGVPNYRFASHFRVLAEED